MHIGIEHGRVADAMPATALGPRPSGHPSVAKGVGPSGAADEGPGPNLVFWAEVMNVGTDGHQIIARAVKRLMRGV